MALLQDKECLIKDMINKVILTFFNREALLLQFSWYTKLRTEPTDEGVQEGEGEDGDGGNEESLFG